MQETARVAFGDQFNLRREGPHEGTAHERLEMRLRHGVDQVQLSSILVNGIRHPRLFSTFSLFHLWQFKLIIINHRNDFYRFMT